MKTLLGLVGLTAILAACAAPGNDATTATNADTATPSWDPDYEVFATRADAEAFMSQHRDDLFGDAALPATDARTIRAQAALDKHWPAIVAKFHPNYPEPIVFVADDDATVNAYAMSDWHTDQAMNIIFVYSGLMKFSDSDLETTLLHETGHLTMKNVIMRYDAALTKLYQADPNAEGVGIAIPNDPNVVATTAPYFDWIGTVGRRDAAELVGLPIADDISPAGLVGFFYDYQSAHNDPSNPDCATFATDFDTASQLANAAVDPFDSMMRLAADASAALSQASTTTEAAALVCLKPPADVDFDAAFSAYANLPIGSFAQARPEEVVTWKGKDALSGMFALFTDVDAKQRAFEARPDYKLLRQYTDEEQADDFELTMLGFEGLDFGLETTQELDFTASDTARAQCSAILASGAVPPYSILDPHHGNCYRAYHATEFKQYLANGGAGVVIPNIPKPPVTATTAVSAMTAKRRPGGAPRPTNSTR